MGVLKAEMSRQILLLNGPNLNMLGQRDPAIYGSTTLDQIVKPLEQAAISAGYTLNAVQSNHEGVLIDEVQRACKNAAGILINPGGFSHTSVALRDALEIFTGPIVEVHLSNIHKREKFRHHSYVSGVATGVICGLGPDGYMAGLQSLIKIIERQP